MPRSNRLTEYNFTFVRVDQIHWLSHRWVVGHQISVFVSCSVGPSGRFSVPQRTRFDIENVSFLLFWFMAIPHVSVVDLKSVQVKVFFSLRTEPISLGNEIGVLVTPDYHMCSDKRTWMWFTVPLIYPIWFRGCNGRVEYFEFTGIVEKQFPDSLIEVLDSFDIDFSLASPPYIDCW